MELTLYLKIKDKNMIKSLVMPSWASRLNDSPKLFGSPAKPLYPISWWSNRPEKTILFPEWDTICFVTNIENNLGFRNCLLHFKNPAYGRQSISGPMQIADSTDAIKIFRFG